VFLKAYYTEVVAVCKAVLNILASTGIECTRQLLLQYRRRIEGNLNTLIMELTTIHGLRSPPVTERTDPREKVRQLLTHIQKPLEDSLKIFKRTGTTYLTHKQNNTTTNLAAC
jgi:hypothetical protein